MALASSFVTADQYKNGKEISEQRLKWCVVCSRKITAELSPGTQQQDWKSTLLLIIKSWVVAGKGDNGYPYLGQFVLLRRSHSLP